MLLPSIKNILIMQAENGIVHEHTITKLDDVITKISAGE
jgi:hypothetical protein